MYRESDLIEEKDRIGRSFGASKNPLILKKALEFSISDDVRSQDCVFIMISVGMSKDGRELAWTFFKENKQLFRERYPVRIYF
jgi:puromycin-sensitive aminopeptidase